MDSEKRTGNKMLYFICQKDCRESNTWIWSGYKTDLRGRSVVACLELAICKYFKSSLLKTSLNPPYSGQCSGIRKIERALRFLYLLQHSTVVHATQVNDF